MNILKHNCVLFRCIYFCTSLVVHFKLESPLEGKIANIKELNVYILEKRDECRSCFTDKGDIDNEINIVALV